MNRKGFSLIELLIVVAIIAVLAGVAVPYYNDYIIDSRTSVLQNNLATIRKAINQFRADNQRGPIRVDLIKDGNTLVAGKVDPFDELVNGPLQYIAGNWVRRSNVKYLSSKPMLIDPATGAILDSTQLELATGSCLYEGTDSDKFVWENDFAFIDSLGDGNYHDFDVSPFNTTKIKPTGTSFKSMDFIDIKLIQQ